MSVTKIGEMIRTEKDLFKTPNIFDYCDNDIVDVYFENFRKNKQQKELILFFEYEGNLYFPVWFEFRSINNNLLFLFYEYSISTFQDLVKVLSSSLEKEEFYIAEFKALVYKTKSKPPFCFPLHGFIINENEKIIVDET